MKNLIDCLRKCFIVFVNKLENLKIQENILENTLNTIAHLLSHLIKTRSINAPYQTIASLFTVSFYFRKPVRTPNDWLASQLIRIALNEWII